MAKTMASLGSKLAAVSEVSDFPTNRHTIKLDFNKGVPFLVGGLEHCLFFHILGIIIPID